MANTENGAKIELEWDRLLNLYDTDGFMEPFLEEMDYVEVEESNGEMSIMPDEHFDIGDCAADIVITIRHGYLAWRSAPGYLDRTDYTPIASPDDLERWFEENFEPIDE